MAPTAILMGFLSSASVASPPSPDNPCVPRPAIVVMVPLGSTLRTTPFEGMAIYRLPIESTANPLGNESRAAVAGPPSPAKPSSPLPATVVILPSSEMRRTRWL